MQTDRLSSGDITMRLSLMMFIQFFIWGSWMVSVGNYMGAHGMTHMIYWAYAVGPLAAIVSPFFLGMVADRFFASERVLAALCLIGAVPMFLAPMLAKIGSIGPLLFILAILVHVLCYMPTLGLTNTLAFHNLTNQEKQFPMIRVFGTLGWIAANWTVSLGVGDASPAQFYITGASCVALGIFSFYLPHTPPPAKGQAVSVRSILGLDALQLFRSPSFVVFIVCSFLICMPLAAYYAYAPVFATAVGYKNPAAFPMSLGQVSEVFFMLAMPLFFVRLGVKWMLAVGMAAWVTRYALFSVAAPNHIYWMIIFGVLLHGICYDFFFVTGFIYTDKKASKEIRGQAQGLLVLVTQGIGMFVGNVVMGPLFNRIVGEKGGLLSYRMFWLIPCIAAGAIMLLFIALFRDDSQAANEKAAPKLEATAS